MNTQVTPFDFSRILLDHQSPVFLLEVVFRTVLIYAATLLVLRWMGKRGLGQLTPFEFAIIIALGSAVGDPMFYDNVPVLPPVITIVVIVFLQRQLARWTERNAVLESFIESEPRLLVEAGAVLYENLHEEMLSRDELFEALRQKGIYQLGQVAAAYLEPSGQVSIISKPHPQPGLSLLPEGKTLPAAVTVHTTTCCQECGRTAPSEQSESEKCPNCGATKWSVATMLDSDDTLATRQPKN